LGWKRLKKFTKVLFTTLLVLYLLILTKEILFKHPLFLNNQFGFQEVWRSSNFIPFKTIIFYLFLADINLNIRIQNLAGNFIGFIPLGFILPLLWNKFSNLKVIFITTFSLSLTYEVLQLIIGLGSFDIDDLILNTLGGALGFCIVKLILLLFQKEEHQKIISK
jgi:glycopeptide antibiotics resistance protein